LLDANFEARRGAMPGVPIPRDEWLLDAATARAPAKIGQIAVHDFGSVAVVSFLQSVGGPQSSPASKERMIVDCWTRSGDRWLLTVRYEGEPAAARSPSRGDKRPSGRQ
jgi:hypothetical protein